MPNLTDVQREKLKKLAGPRYNPDKDIVRMSCDSFESQAQNKRYLGDLVDSLLHESRVSLYKYIGDNLTDDARLETLLKTFLSICDIIALSLSPNSPSNGR